MSDDREQMARRAREVLDGAGWLFDDFVNAQMRRILISAPHEYKAREEAYRRARVATELKMTLEATLEQHQADQRQQARRDQLKESRDGR